MNPLRKAFRPIGRGVKALAMRFAGVPSWNWLGVYGRSRYDYASVTDAFSNSAAMAAAGWIARTFPEAPLQVVRTLRDGSEEPVPGHDLVTLLDRPNEFYSGVLLWSATIIDLCFSGNAYWLKVRSGAGRVVQIWYVPQALINPAWPQDGSVFISHYTYSPNGIPLRVEVEDIVHFRMGIDPKNPRKGLSPLGSALREIFTDDEAASFSAALLRNLGVPGVVLSPADSEGHISEPEANAMKQSFKAKFGEDNRGEPMVAPTNLKVQVLSFTPEQMNLTNLRRLPEERVTALLGVPAVVVGLGAGLERSTYSNYETAKAAAYESCLIPLHRLLSSELRTQLLDDFGGTAGLGVRFDTSKVRALQEDQTKLYERADKAVQGGWMTVRQALAMVGQPSGPADEYYVRSTRSYTVPAKDAGLWFVPTSAPAQPEPGQLQPPNVTPIRPGVSPLPLPVASPSGATATEEGR